jgi:molybdate-binding protein
MKMDIRDLVKRLEDIETQARDKREYEVEDSVGRLIEDLIEEDLENERVFAKQVAKYIDEKIENEIVARAVKNGTIAKA